MSGEVSTSQAEADLRALEGFLAANQDLERLDALLDHFNIFEVAGWYWGWSTRMRGANEYRLLTGSSLCSSLRMKPSSLRRPQASSSWSATGGPGRAIIHYFYRE
jgi:hypothetical protein